MAIPTYDQFIEPLLRVLGEHPEGLRSGQVYTQLAARIPLSDAEQQLLLPSRQQPVFQNRIGWAHDRLKRAGLSSSARRGVWALTDAGLAYVRAHRGPLDEDAIAALASVERGHRLRGADEAEPASSETTSPMARTASPDERIDEAVAELREKAARDLLELIGASSPQFFEQLVLDLLYTLGYGTSQGDLQRTGRSGDGGIDGIISLDRLGLEKVYVQAKRWRGSVGRPDVQGFFGAVAAKRAKKGVFITTSSYTREAREFSENVPEIVLIDGERLTELMIDHGVAVTHKDIKIPAADRDYFEDL